MLNYRTIVCLIYIDEVKVSIVYLFYLEKLAAVMHQELQQLIIWFYRNTLFHFH